MLEALKVDGSNVTLHAMPGITNSHVNPDNFEKMRVNYAFQLFGDCLEWAASVQLESKFGSIEPLLIFFG